MRAMLPIVLLLAVRFCVFQAHAQDAHQAKEWHCVRQGFAETSDGNVSVVPCTAALPQGENLTPDDELIVAKLETIRYNATTFKMLKKENPQKWSSDYPESTDLENSISVGFGEKVGQICKKHPNIVLAPLFPDQNSAAITLYSCKNIATVSEK
jgi:hypothetical protein